MCVSGPLSQLDATLQGNKVTVDQKGSSLLTRCLTD